MPQNINLNVSPYYDDFSEDKNYYKVLFKPGTSIQARELTTLQSILQNQIEKFGKHFFKDGAMIIPGNIAYDDNYTCIEINSIHLGIPVSAYLNDLIGKTIKGRISNIVAKIESVLDESTSERGNATLYIKYQSSSQSDFTSSKFIDGEDLIIQEDVNYSLGILSKDDTIATTISNDCNSIGSAVKISSGVYFIRGYFLNIDSQTLILDQYDNLPSYRVGLLIKESFATASSEYNDLLDNSQGFYNFAAPGADRLLIQTELIKKPLGDFNDDNFVQLLKLEDGVLETIVKNTSYNVFADELARRTYDESGDYYVKPFDLEIKESLNDYLGNNGIYFDTQTTKQGNIPSDNLSCLSISPGKAYVKGYEVETISNTIIDIEKPRTTDVAINEAIQFNFGAQIQLNNVYGVVPVGYGTESYVKLYDKRTEVVGVAAGKQIGLARLYNLKLKSSEYLNESSVFDMSLYDIQTYTTLTISSGIGTDLLESTYVEGKNSGANGYVVSGIGSTEVEFDLYQVSGNFIKNESIIINGLENNRIITNVKDYGLNDVYQITSYNTSPATFTADPVLSRKVNLSDNQSAYTISASVGGISTITTSNGNFYSNVKIGDVISYTKSGDTLPTYNAITSIDLDLSTVGITSLSDVNKVNNGSLPSSLITVNDLRKVTLDIVNDNVSLYSNLNHKYVSSVDLTGSNITLTKTLPPFTITNSEVFQVPVFVGVNDSILVPFDEEAYTLVYSDGSIETLSSQKLIPNRDSSNNVAQGLITLRNLDVTSPVSAYLTITYQKLNCKTRKKTYNKSYQLIIDKTNSSSNTIGTGLTYSGVYGSRIEDSVISLNVPEVESVIGIYESSDANDPILPSFNVDSISSSITNLIQGEEIVGVDSKSIATLISSDNISNIKFGYLNEKTFNVGEIVTFKQSGITARITSINVGSKNILSSYLFDDGSRESYLDFSRIVRKSFSESPKRKITIVYNYYSIENDDNGDFVTVNSYDSNNYKKIPLISNNSCTDIVDFRPRVVNYSTASTYSPFDFKSRVFNDNVASSKGIVAKDNSIVLSYNYYLPRIDKLFLSKNGTFNLIKGVPSLTPKLPGSLDYSLEVATINLPPYVYDVSDIKITTNKHKRYTMKDISTLDDRISNVEYYTSLSLLESETQNLTITDPDTNLNRFKCGFFVDNFSSYDGGDISNQLYKASVDVSNNNLRPQFYTSYLDLELNNNTNNNVKKVGNVVCLDYNDVVYAQNKFATRTENVNPFNVISWIGSINLNPPTDTWVEPRIVNKKTTDVEGDYLSVINSLNIDSNTGLSPIEWNSWQIDWAGEPKTTDVGPTTKTLKSSKTTKNSNKFTKVKTFTNTNSVNVSREVNKSRTGIQSKVTESYDYQVIGSRVLSREVVTTIRSRNIGIVAKRLKPNTQFYAFFDNIDVSNYIVPKLIEIEMSSGTFSVGEIVKGQIGTNLINFKIAAQNHKTGSILAPIETYIKNPYDNSSTIPSNYSSTSSLLNVDTETLSLQSESGYYGSIGVGMKLIGQTSGAIATVKDLRIISDNSGVFIGSLFIPDPSISSNPKFSTGEKTFTLSTSKINSSTIGATQSRAETSFISKGLIENTEEQGLKIRNATIERVPKSDTTTVTDTETIVKTFETTKTKKWVDPLAQSFEVVEDTGVYVTKCDVFFTTKDPNNIPVTIQIRTMQNGVPTQVVLPFSEVTLNPSEVNVSDTSLVATTFTFPSPVYLDGGTSYSIVLISDSDSYNVWISRMGEEDVTSLNSQEGNRVLVSQQPTLGSLFKSQNASTWDASQYEDLKFTLYRADFTSTSGTVTFNNPELGVGNRQIASLRPNPITSYSRELLVKLNDNLSESNINLLKSGYKLYQDGNTSFSSNVKSIVGSITLSSSLEIINPGIGYTEGITSYTDVDLISLTGNGSGGKITLGVGTGVAYSATISNSGSGYSVGDVLTIDYKDTNNLGKEVIFTIPNTVGILTSSNAIIIDQVQGDLVISGGDLVSNSTTISGIYPSEISEISDGLHFNVNLNNHGMYSENNFVTLYDIEPDVPPSKLVEDVTQSSTTIKLDDVSNFVLFEGTLVSIGYTGYLKIDGEIIGYVGVDTSTSTITLNTTPTYSRGIDGTRTTSHFSNSLVFKYEFNGISLRKINKTHNLADVNYSKYSIGIDNYYVKIEDSNNKYFKESKTGGSYLYDSYALNGPNSPKSTQNISYSIVQPITNILTPSNTQISSKLRTVSSTSVNGTEISFLDNGYEDISLNSNNYFNSIRGIYSRVNELEYLSNLNNKSLSLQIQLNTSNSKVSPMIDLERIGMIFISNRVNAPISNYVMDSRVNKLIDDPNCAIYISKVVKLEKPADNLKVLFDAYRHTSNDIRVLYRLFRNDAPDEYQLYQLFPGYGNINSRGNTIDQSKCNGLPDNLVTPSGNSNEFKSYEYNMRSDIIFTGFQIKIIMAGTDQANVPKIRDLRAIATL